MVGVSLYRREIERAAADYRLDPDLVEAVVMVESSGHADAFRFEPKFWQRYLQAKAEYRDLNPRRVSSSYGLMQVMFPVARETGFTAEPEYLFVPETNLDVGCHHLMRLLAWAHGDVDKAVGAYNAGRGAWDSPAAQAYREKVRASLARVRAARAERRA